MRRLTRLLVAAVGLSLVWYLAADRLTRSTSAARVSGNVVPLVPEVPGVVTDVHVDVNRRMMQGDVLIEIDPASYALEVERAEAELEQAGGSIGAETSGVAAPR